VIRCVFNGEPADSLRRHRRLRRRRLIGRRHPVYYQVCNFKGQEGVMNGSNGQPPANGHALSVDRVIDAEPEAIFDGFIAMYDSQRPDWVTGSELDLRPGGRWTVDFQVLSEPASRMSAG
jgi:hypothetical protein